MRFEVRTLKEAVDAELGQRSRSFVEGFDLAFPSWTSRSTAAMAAAPPGASPGTPPRRTRSPGGTWVTIGATAKSRALERNSTFQHGLTQVFEDAPPGWWGTALPPADWRVARPLGPRPTAGMQLRNEQGAELNAELLALGRAEEAQQAPAANKAKIKDEKRDKDRRKRARDAPSSRARSCSRAKKKVNTSKRDKKAQNEGTGKRSRRSPSESVEKCSQSVKRGVPIARIWKWRCEMCRYVNFGFRETYWRCSAPPPPEVKRLRDLRAAELKAVVTGDGTQQHFIGMRHGSQVVRVFDFLGGSMPVSGSIGMHGIISIKVIGPRDEQVKDHNFTQGIGSDVEFSGAEMAVALVFDVGEKSYGIGKDMAISNEIDELVALGCDVGVAQDGNGEEVEFHIVEEKLERGFEHVALGFNPRDVKDGVGFPEDAAQKERPCQVIEVAGKKVRKGLVKLHTGVGDIESGKKSALEVVTGVGDEDKQLQVGGEARSGLLREEACGAGVAHLSEVSDMQEAVKMMKDLLSRIHAHRLRLPRIACCTPRRKDGHPSTAASHVVAAIGWFPRNSKDPQVGADIPVPEGRASLVLEAVRAHLHRERLLIYRAPFAPGAQVEAGILRVCAFVDRSVPAAEARRVRSDIFVAAALAAAQEDPEMVDAALRRAQLAEANEAILDVEAEGMKVNEAKAKATSDGSPFTSAWQKAILPKSGRPFWWRLKADGEPQVSLLNPEQ
ncbi:unnamed protein product [Prorocentrum cordatum]|uniref:RanBP2-type domain-containing protein n=1 Tax=Prorocentrum cordatum TaxID=2364126 RepID=A0ABN9W2Y2_9DINO|nr:unnamed protein product [Polarella glacialis]